MKNLLLIFCFLIFTGCKNEKQFKPKTENEIIESVEINAQGGQLGYYSHLLITKDSVLFSLGTAADSTNNKSYSVTNKPESWGNLVKEIDIRNFENAKEGESRQPVDGTDTEITIKTNKKEIKKMNADDNSTWQRISTYSEFYYPQNLEV